MNLCFLLFPWNKNYKLYAKLILRRKEYVQSGVFVKGVEIPHRGLKLVFSDLHAGVSSGCSWS